MASDREVLTELMEIIDSLKFALTKAKRVDGKVAQQIEEPLNSAISSAGKMAYRIQRETWDAQGGTYEL
jgi:hypothetical protein